MLNKTRNTIFGVMGLVSAISGVLLISSYIVNLPENTKALPVPNQQVAFTGTISRVDIETALYDNMYTPKDVTCLARNIYFEARNESVLGQHMVAWTTLNRVKHKRWRSTVCGVVYQRKQFSWTIKDSKRRTYNHRAYKRAVLIAKDTLTEFYTGGEDLSKGALYYHADYVTPIWRHGLIKIAQVDTHIFYKNK